MKRLVIASALVAALSSCAQSQMPKSQVGNGSQPTVKNFDSCGLSVRFSGQPEALTTGQADQFQQLFGVKPMGPSWRYLSHILDVSKNETAFCVCPPQQKLREWKLELNATSVHLEGVGTTYEVATTELDGGSKMTMKTTVSDSAPDCMVVQYVVAKGNTNAIGSAIAPFFASPLAIPSTQENIAISRTDGSADLETKQLEKSRTGKSASERLKQLDSLLVEKLISEDEHKKRRAIILESL